jgi:hypothetical protein
MIAQLSERAELEVVLTDLFDVKGSAIALHPASWYVRSSPPFAQPFIQVAAAARARGEVALGYRLARDDDGAPAVVLNPPKFYGVALGDDDQVIVIAPH